MTMNILYIYTNIYGQPLRYSKGIKARKREENRDFREENDIRKLEMCSHRYAIHTHILYS